MYPVALPEARTPMQSSVLHVAVANHPPIACRSRLEGVFVAISGRMRVAGEPTRWRQAR